MAGETMLQTEGSVEEFGFGPRARVLMVGETMVRTAGSALHGKGCKPCLFVHTPIGCKHGEACGFCHFTHTARCPRRKRIRYKNLIDRLCAEQRQERDAAMGEEWGENADPEETPHSSPLLLEAISKPDRIIFKGQFGSVGAAIACFGVPVEPVGPFQ